MSSNPLKVKLADLEKEATAIERNVLRLLTLLEKPKRHGAYVVEEAVIMTKLWKLDELQEEIDAILAELKAAGEWEPVSYAGNVYQYNPPAPVKVEPKKTKVYPALAPTQAKLTKHVPDRDRVAARKAREAARKAPREAKAPSTRPPKAKPVTRSRKPAASAELRAARKLQTDNNHKIRDLDNYLEGVKTKTEANIVYQQGKLEAAQSLRWMDQGPQKRAKAATSIENSQRKIAELPERRVKTLNLLMERKARYDAEVARLTAIEFPSENHSQV